MVLQDPRHWYSEEGELSKTICEQTAKDIKYDENDCCACDEAKYSVNKNKLTIRLIQLIIFRF